MDEKRAGKKSLGKRFRFLSHFSLPAFLDKWPCPTSRAARSKEKTQVRKEVDDALLDSVVESFFDSSD